MASVANYNPFWFLRLHLHFSVVNELNTIIWQRCRNLVQQEDCGTHEFKIDVLPFKQND